MGVGKGGLGEGLEWWAQFLAICERYKSVSISMVAIIVGGSVAAFAFYTFAPHDGSVSIINIGTGSLSVSPNIARSVTAPTVRQDATPPTATAPTHDDNPRQIFSNAADAQSHGALDLAWNLYEAVLKKDPHSVSAMIRCSQVARQMMTNGATDPDICRSKLTALRADLIKELNTPTGLSRHQIGLARAEILEIDRMIHLRNSTSITARPQPEFHFGSSVPL